MLEINLRQQHILYDPISIMLASVYTGKGEIECNMKFGCI